MEILGIRSEPILWSVSIVAQWSAREDDLNLCTRGACAYFSTIGTITDVLTTWSQKAWSKKSAMMMPNLNLASEHVVKELLLKGQNREDKKPYRVIPSLGYRLSFWNKDVGGISASVSIHCGSFEPRISNSVVLEMNRAADGEPVDAKMQVQLLKDTIEVWQASVGVVLRTASGPHPMGLPDDPAELQLAFFSTPEKRGQAAWGPRGISIESIAGGTLWVDETMSPYFEL